MGSLSGLRTFGKSGAQPLRELALHFPGLGAQHRLPKAAELAGQCRVDLVADFGCAVLLDQLGQRARGQSPDDSERNAFNLGLDLARWVGAHDLDGDLELEPE